MSGVDPRAKGPRASTPVDERKILDALTEAVIVADEVNVIVDANRAAERLLGWARQDLVGQPLTTLIPPRLRDAHIEAFSRFVLTGEARIMGSPVRVSALRADGAEVPVELNLAEFDEGGQRRIVGVLRDVTPAVALERQVAMTEYFQATTEVAVLLGLSGKAHSLDDAAPLVLAAVGDSLRWQVGNLWLVDWDRNVLRCTHRWFAPELDTAAFSEFNETETFARGEGLPGLVWETGEPQWVEDFASGPWPRAQAAAAAGLHGAFAFPIVTGRTMLGVMEFFLREVTPPNPDLMGVVATIGLQLGQFIERSWAEVELMASRERFADLARTLQATLLPPALPQIAGLELGARYTPASSDVEVGGDFYDLFPTRGSTWAMVIGDVCGRGAEAATQTAVARYTLRTAALQARRPSRMLATLNEVVLRSADDERFLTAAVLTVRPREGRVTLALGGHPQPVLLAADGTASLVGKPGMIVGALERSDVPDTSLTLEAGDALILYTDGVLEARQGTEQFGTRRLVELVEACRGLDADTIAGRLLDAVREFQGGEGDDDVAILVLRRTPR